MGLFKQTAIASLLATVLLLPGKPSLSQPLLEILEDDRYPLSFQLKDLDSSWRVFSISGQLEAGLFLTIIGSFIGVVPNEYYTQGETVNVGDRTYLVVYGIPFSVTEAAPEAPVTLSLLNLRAISTMNKIQPFDLDAELAKLQIRLQPPDLFPFGSEEDSENPGNNPDLPPLPPDFFPLPPITPPSSIDLPPQPPSVPMPSRAE
ncbi:MAG: hypothetical protein ACLFV6_01580 [Spirulinaceae cyanobacterium]